MVVYMATPLPTRQVDYYRMSPEEALGALRSRQEGLTAAEAAERLTANGPNGLNTKRRDPPWRKFFRQFKDLMIILLAVSALIALYLGDSRTAVVLLAIVLFNTTIGFLQEFKAEKVMESLEKLVVATAHVLRGGKLVEIPSAEVVVGDVVYVEEGDSVPADIRTLTEEELSSNDFALTGESNPTRKFIHALSADIPLSGRQNMLFMGTTVATGHGYGVVVGTGIHTELGRIASLSQDTVKEDSPLQKEMNNIATRVTQGTVLLCLVLLPLAVHGGLTIKAAFLFAIGIAASIIPQGLPAEINTSLARAAGQLARARALVKKLSAVEGLGATSVICTDKTGTLTKNQMTVEQLLVSHTAYLVTGNGYEPQGVVLDVKKEPIHPDTLKELELFFTTGALACNARVNPPDGEHPGWYCLGDPTEGAIVTLAQKVGLDTQALDKKYPELHEFGFDSARKRMSSLRKYNKRLYLFVKGAPESVLEHCTHIADHGKVRKLHPADRKFLLGRNDKLAGQAMRNLAIAYRVMPVKTNVKKLTIDEAETDLVWLGMVSMIDPLREEVPDAMDAARAAHIKVSIVTGDYAPTAKAIAMRARLTDDPKNIVVVSGDELGRLSDARVLDLATRGGVIFSRVAPEDKMRIVRLVQESGRVVAVTGDGINDAPALKKADIGVAMGVTGTDVAKQAAEIVLLDDSFHTLVGTIQEGRVIFQNIRKGALSAFTSNAAELVVNLLSLAAATLYGTPLAISVMLILAIDLIAELFPIAALGGDKADHELMTEPPRNPHDHILNKWSILDLIWCGLLIGGFAFANFLWFFARNGLDVRHVAEGTTPHMQAAALTYLTIVLCQLANILQRRSRQGLFTRYQFHNKSFWLAMLLSLFCVFNIIYNPWVAPYFKAGPLGIVDWAWALAATAAFIAIREFQRYSSKHSRKAVLELHRQTRTTAKTN
jgi:P-type Ca2+ transporter type 2C